MGELAARTATRAPPHIGCRQVREIVYTDGVALVGPLPDRFELATGYTAAVSHAAAQPALAERLITLRVGPGSRALREAGGRVLSAPPSLHRRRCIASVAACPATGQRPA